MQNRLRARSRTLNRDRIAFLWKDRPHVSAGTRIWRRLLPLLPVLFIAGWLANTDTFGDKGTFALVSLWAVLGALLLVFSLRRSVEGAFPIIILIAIFYIGYFLKFYWMIGLLANPDPAILVATGLEAPIVSVLQPQYLLRAFELGTWGFGGLCLAALVTRTCRLIPAGSPVSFRIPEWQVRRLAGAFLITGWVLFVATAIVVYRLGIGVRGGEEVQLPFKLAGALAHLREVPGALFLLVVAWTDRKDLRTYWWMALTGLISHFLSFVFIEAIRGALISLVLVLGTIWLVYRRFTMKRLCVLITALVLVMLLRPFFTVYRDLRAAGFSDAQVVEMATRAYRNFEERTASNDDWVGWTANRFMVLAVRMVGTDSVLYFAPMEHVQIDPARWLLVLTGREDFTRNFTHEIVGYGSDVRAQFTSTSLVGGLYWLGGVGGVICGVFWFALIVQWVWHLLWRVRWRTAPLALAQVVSFTFSIGNDAAFESRLREIGVAITLIALLEVTSRISLRAGRESIRTSGFGQLR